MDKQATLEHYERVLAEAQAAEFDRAVRASRLEAGLIAARWEAKHIGRYPDPTDEKDREIEELAFLSAIYREPQL